MKCPHCNNGIHAEFYIKYFISFPRYEPAKKFSIYYNRCPECKEYLIYFDIMDENEIEFKFGTSKGDVTPADEGAKLVYPSDRSKALSSDVPEDYSSEFKESYSVLSLSPKASAALSRRLLQKLLEEKGNIIGGDLSYEIQQVIDSKQLPQHLSDSIDAIRNIGNFSAHPTKSKVTGEIVDVEEGEAEWNLEVLDGLLDFYFVQPAATERRKNNLNQKLSAHGKPPMK